MLVVTALLPIGFVGNEPVNGWDTLWLLQYKAINELFTSSPNLENKAP